MRITPILLIGAQKSGSTYLFRLLASDPAVARAWLKEPKIFSKPMHDGDAFLSHFCLDPVHRFALDGSVSYMHVAGTADQVARRLGTGIPMIAVLRDPVERAVSGYLHEVKHGRELRSPERVFNLPTDSLTDAIAAEDVAIDRAWRQGEIQPHNPPEQRYRDPFFQFRFVENSWYSKQLAPWLELFPNLRFVAFSDLQQRPVEVVNRLRGWIGLDQSYKIDVSVSRNATQLSLWRALRENRALQHDHRRPGIFEVWARHRALLRRLQAEKPWLPPALAMALREDFNHISKVEAQRWI